MRTLFGFVIGLLTTFLVLTFLPIPSTWRLADLSADSIRLNQVYNRIVYDVRPIDVAFIGTSHTMNGMADSEIEKSLPGLHIANLGVMWMGRDLQLFLVKRLSEHKKPKLIIVEIGEHESPYGHPLMPYVGSTSDMFCCAFWADFNFPRMALLFLKEQICGLFFGEHRDSQSWQYGWLPVDKIWNGLTSCSPPLAISSSAGWETARDG